MKVKLAITFPQWKGFHPTIQDSIIPSFYETHQPSYSRSSFAIIAINPGFSSAAVIGREIFGRA
jgi:hypothetical protein